MGLEFVNKLPSPQEIREQFPLPTGLDRVKFKQVVRPGDTIEFTCSLVKTRGPFYFAEGKGRVNGKVCVSGEFSFALIPNEG